MTHCDREYHVYGPCGLGIVYFDLLQLRERCRKHVESQRELLLERARASRQDGNMIQNDLIGIIQSEEKDMNEKEQMTEPDKRLLRHEEYVDLMHSLEQELYQDQQADELEYLESLEKKEVHDMVEAHIVTAPCLQGTLCPVCGINWLSEWHGQIVCPSGDLRLDTSFEGMGLEALRQRLQSVCSTHASRCPGTLVFHQRKSSPDQGACLVAECADCHGLEVVL